jgi:very-short-patch-repair endonuclease
MRCEGMVEITNWNSPSPSPKSFGEYCTNCNELLTSDNCFSKTKLRKKLCNKCSRILKRQNNWEKYMKSRIPRIIKKPRKIKDSVQQRILFEELKRKLNPKYLKYNFPVRTRTEERIWNMRYIDVAYTIEHLAFEYDGEQWHQKPDKKRDNELKRAGWKVIHINKYNIQKFLDSF